MTRVPPREEARFVPRMKRALLLVPLVLGGLACERLAGPEQYARVHVTTTTPDGAPAADVPVELYTGQRPIEYATTDGAGQYSFERVPPALRNYAVVVSVPPAYRDSGDAAFVASTSFDLPARSTHDVSFVLAPCAGAIAVTVLDQNGRPAPQVSMRLYSPDQPEVGSATGSDGTKVYDGVRCDDYGVQLLPSVGYVLEGGRDTSYTDGIRLHRGDRKQVSLRIRTTP